jgi:beta-glucosidase
LKTKRAPTAPCFPGATIFPEGLAIGSTFDLDLVGSVYAAAAAEARAVGIHMLSTLVLELDRDPRMGRNEEAYTEDPYLYSRIAESIVQGTQGTNIAAADKVIAVLDGFPYSKRARQRPGTRRHRIIGARFA